MLNGSTQIYQTGLILGLIELQKAELPDWHFDGYKLASEEIACKITCHWEKWMLL
jgi:hypothetical protein